MGVVKLDRRQLGPGSPEQTIKDALLDGDLDVEVL